MHWTRQHSAQQLLRAKQKAARSFAANLRQQHAWHAQLQYMAHPEIPIIEPAAPPSLLGELIWQLQAHRHEALGLTLPHCLQVAAILMPAARRPDVDLSMLLTLLLSQSRQHPKQALKVF